MITFGSLFAGIGGIDLGLERAGMTCKWQVENDPYAIRVLQKHWPHVRRHDDVRTFPPAGEWGCDLIAGGFPCQPVSLAGRMAAEDERWLWGEMARVIGILRPRLVLVENVPGLLIRRFGEVLGDLASLGFDAEWDCYPAAAFGADHWRRRVFLLAYSREERRPRILRGNKIHLKAPFRQRQAIALDDVRSVVRRIEQGVGQPGVFRSPDGVPCRLDRLRVIGEAVDPRVSEWIGRRIVESERAGVSVD